MAILEEKNHAGEFLHGPGVDRVSIDNGTLEVGHVVEPGTVLAAGATDGSFKPCGDVDTATGIALYGYNSTDAVVKIAVVARTAPVSRPHLIFDASVTDEDAKIADLKALGILAR